MRTKGSKGKPVDTGVYLYVPAKFRPEDFPDIRGCENEANWLLHKIVTTACLHRHDKWHDGMSRISTRTMETFIGPAKTGLVKRTLIESDVVVWDQSYRISTTEIEGYSQSYGLGPAYSGDLRRVPVTSRSLAAKVLAHRLTVGNRPVTEDQLDETYAYLKRWLRKAHIDVEAAYASIEQQPDQPPKVVKRRVGKRGRRRIVKVAMPSAKAFNRMTVDTIANGEVEFTPCQFGRVHTNVTRLATECRVALSIDGQRLASVDIRNSQLVFFLLMLMETRYLNISDRAANVLFTGQPSSSGNQAADRTKPPQTNTLRTKIYAVDGDRRHNRSMPEENGYLKADEHRFKTSVLEGSIYEELMLATGYTDRRKFKGDFFESVLYGDNTKYYSKASPIARYFKHAFPTVWQFILDQKRDGYERLAQNMQRRESRFMIGRVVGRLAEHHPEVPALTIHDSIMTTEANLETVRRIIMEEFDRLGVRPRKINIEHASTEAA